MVSHRCEWMDEEDGPIVQGPYTSNGVVLWCMWIQRRHTIIKYCPYCGKKLGDDDDRRKEVNDGENPE